MDKEYYLIALNHNESKDPMKIDEVIYKGEMYDLPEVMEEAVLRSVYEPLEILAVKGMFGIRDLISGESLLASNNGMANGVSYFKCVKASRSDIIRITKKYESMSNEDILRYKEAINRIKEKSVSRYLENQNRLVKEIYEEKCARDFLVRFQEWNA